MADDWTPVHLGDVTDILTGFPFKSERYVEDASAPRLLRGDNVAQGVLRWDSAKRWPSDDAEEVTPYKLREGDVILAMDRPWIEAGLKYASVRQSDLPALLVQRVARLRGTNRLDTGFLKYVIGSQDFTDYVLAIQTGTAVPHISSSQIRSFEFLLPPLPEQRAIAHVLGTLDDKIELNRKTNETLEAMARALFMSWFVDFEPVRAKAEGRPTGLPPEIDKLFPDSFEDSELGEVPKGWRVGTLSDIVTNVVERVMPSSETESMPYVPIECITPNSLFLSETQPGMNAQSSLIMFNKDDIIFGAMRPYFHKVCIAPYKGTTRTTAFILRSDVMEVYYAASVISQDTTIQFATENSEGTTIPYAKWSNSMEKMNIVIPPQELRQTFHTIAKPMVNSAMAAIEQSRSLASLRDALLPKLISGEVRIPNGYVKEVTSS